jgi:2-keto-4-pentenoate hydratase/2-oxohepta-3-ene-1,7-dioic acid hydratase in catechol pathway
MSYRLLTYRAAAKEARAGILVGDLVYDAARACASAKYATVLDVLADWRAAERKLRDAAKRIAAGKSKVKGTPLVKTKLLAPVLYPGAIFCAGANYVDHVAEMLRVQGKPLEPNPKEIGLKPWHFIKTSRGSVVAPGADVKLPAYSKMMDWEIELTAVIGRPAKDVPVEKALDYVAGYTIANDLSARDAMRRQGMPETSPFHYDWISQKCFDGACPLGPWITPARDIGDPQNLAMKLWVNGALMQDSNTAQMIFSTADQIAQLSSRVTLQPGDLILTGTPAGVGMGRKLFLQQGDVVKLWIDKIGEFAHKMI